MSKLYMTFASGSVAERLRKEPGVIAANGHETILLAEGDKSPFKSGKVFEIEEASGEFVKKGNILYANIPADENARSLLFHQLLTEKAPLGVGHEGFSAYRLGVDPDDHHAVVFIQFTSGGKHFRDTADYAVLEDRLKRAVEQRGSGPVIKHYVVTESDNL
ncbi:MAG: hypothetical protein WBV10_01535 [Exiguobacterium marinum]|uniref:Antibiotic biosynthesis monooxygenase n=1 Tax=Exiguobacterium marinum TaxID=273528 RepID=A0ABY7WZ98_9BACL|nr:hypothetical protein [Exiguobacterium marinum]WDH76195.1 hypothetical protein PTI97_01265 [Exiguobacterium marinum]